MHAVRSTLSTLLDLLFPRPQQVAVLDQISSDVLAKRVRIIHVPVSFSCIALLPYKEKMVQSAIKAAKYHGHAHSATILGKVIAPHIAEELGEQRQFGLYHEVVVIPIPLHKKRQKERGFNQATRIAKVMCAHLYDNSIHINDTSLARTKYTHAQARRHSRQERIANMKGAFTIHNTEHVTGRDIILLDDVVTTGATLSSARTALLEAGARNVLCVAVAH